jgi:tartrate-resistant acid phosphatase type 5
MKWLQEQLAASCATWQIVYFYHAPYSSSRVHGSTTAMQWPFASWGADAVLSGHDHTYERNFVDGIVYFINGLGGDSIYDFSISIPGSQVRYNGDYGAMRIHANDVSITFEFINASGEVIDTYTIE